MKFGFVLSFVCLVSLSANVFSQDQALTLNTKNVALHDLFKEIEKQSNYRFFYNDELININKSINLDVKNVSIDDVLTGLLQNTGLQYRKLDNNLIVISSIELLQGITISGTVTDVSGAPLPGATITIKGTMTGTVTDYNGRFSLNVPNSQTVLVFSSVGYATVEMEVGAQRILDIVMDESSVELDEVVVVAYGTAKKKDLTGSITSVDAQTLQLQANSSVSRSLEGIAPGIQVQASDGQPGLDMNIRVRGLGSTNADAANALVVVDGVPMLNANPLSTINPNDIASLSILKDAASTALYGSRGANGVIMITTKKGRTGKAKVSVGARWGVNTVTNNMMEVMNSPQEIYENMWQLIYNSYRFGDPGTGRAFRDANGNLTNHVQSPLHTDEDARQFASAHLFDYSGNSASFGRNSLSNYMLYDVPGAVYTPTGSGTTQSATMSGAYLVNTDGKLNPSARLLYYDNYKDLVLKNKFRQEYDINVSGGMDKLDYFVSLGMLQDPSYIDMSYFDRYTGRAALNSQVAKWLKIGANVGFTHRKTNGMPTRDGGEGGTLQGGTNRGDSYENPFSFIASEYLAPMYARDKNGNYIYDANGEKKMNNQQDDVYSPLGHTPSSTAGAFMDMLKYDKNEAIDNNITTRTYADIKFLKDFTFTVNFSLDQYFRNFTAYRNPYSGRGTTGNVDGWLVKRNTTTQNINTQQLLSWNHDYGLHHVDALVGHEYNEYKYETLIYTSGFGLIPEFTGFDNFVGRYIGGRLYNSGIRIDNPGGNGEKQAMESYLSRANYIYNNKYYLSGTLRFDGSSKFKKKGDKWGTFWSVGAGWRISAEDFMSQTQSWLNNLKIRGSYGVIGNQNGISAYQTYATWAYGASYSSRSDGIGVPSGYTFSAPGAINENLTWENTNTLDLGVDLDLFNRFHLIFDWYNRETTNSFWNETLTYSTNLGGSITTNEASLRNRGLEVDLGIDILRTEDWTWSMNLNGTHFTTVLTKLPNGQGMAKYDGTKIEVSEGNSNPAWLRGEGLPYYNLFMYRYAGPDPNTGVPMYYGKDDNGKEYTTTNPDKAVPFELGDALPKWMGGFSTSLRYKNIDFTAVLSYQLGGKYYHKPFVYLYDGDGRDGYNAGSSDMKGNMWTLDNHGAKFPIAMFNDNNQGIAAHAGGLWKMTDLVMVNASYFNVKNITIGYTLPSVWTQKLNLSNVRIYASGDNIFMLSKLKGVDPRMSLTGGFNVDSFVYPYLRTFNFGINVDF